MKISDGWKMSCIKGTTSSQRLRLENVPDGQGYEAWRKLHPAYDSRFEAWDVALTYHGDLLESAIGAVGRSDSTAIGISSRPAGKLRLEVKELVQVLVQARKLVVTKVGTDGDPTDVGTKFIEDGKKLLHLLGLGGVRMKKSLAEVVL